MPLFNPAALPHPTGYLFIDGGNLAASIRKVCGDALEGVSPAVRWSSIRANFGKVFYYDAVPAQKRGEEDAMYALRVKSKLEELRAIERETGFHVRSGDTHDGGRRGPRQKKVDVQLAVDALLMASRGLFGRATLMTGDLDFKPLISALVEMGVDVHLTYPEGETSEELIAAADSAAPLSTVEILGFLDLEAAGIRRPYARSIFIDQPYEMGDVLTSWVDARFGLCHLSKEGLWSYQLTTERSANNPQTHRLLVSCDSLQLLRAYALGGQGIEIPPI